MAQIDPFEALGVPRDATAAEIKSVYRKLARRYHPNRHPQCDDPDPIATEHFHSINQAWKLLSRPDSRRRYLELLELLDEQQSISVRLADLLSGDSEKNSKDEGNLQANDGHVSSDGDDDALPHIGLARRQTVLERTMTGGAHLGDSAEIVEPRGQMRALIQRRIKGNDSAFHLPALSTQDTGTKGSDYFTLRRKKLEKLKRREGESFFRYRDAMVAKFEAELESERTREHYEQAKWKREYFERAPRETAQRMKSFQQFMGAFRAFTQPRGRRRNRSTLNYSGQILSTDDVIDNGQYLTPENIASPSQRRAHHRGWSSDISGDQTSSDENSSDSRGTSRPHASWVWHRHHSRHALMDALRHKVHSVIPHHHDSPVKSPAKSADSDLDRKPTPFQTNCQKTHRIWRYHGSARTR